MWPTVYALVGLVFGLVLVFTHPSTRKKALSTRIVVGLLAGFGIGVVFNAGRELFEFVRGVSVTKRSIPEAEDYVKQQIEEQSKQKVTSIHLHDNPSGGFVGEAQVGQAVYDVTVAADGRWQARRR